MLKTKQLPQADWLGYFSAFSNVNKGRLIDIEVIGMANGDQPLAKSSPLFAIDYDPVSKGDNCTITTGDNSIDYTHTINSPTEIWQEQDDNGKVLSLAISDAESNQTIIMFKS